MANQVQAPDRDEPSRAAVAATVVDSAAGSDPQTWIALIWRIFSADPSSNAKAIRAALLIISLAAAACIALYVIHQFS
jgi:hypothetical protein